MTAPELNIFLNVKVADFESTRYLVTKKCKVATSIFF